MNMVPKVVYVEVGQIKKIVSLLCYAQKFMPNGKNFGCIVWGESGVGKTMETDNVSSIVSKVTGETWGFHDINLASSSPEDFGGVPVTSDGKPKMVSIAPVLKEEFGIVRADEIDRPSRQETLNAFVRWSIDRNTDNPVPPKWFILGMGNGISDENTLELDEKTRGRMCHIYVSCNTQFSRDNMLKYWEKRNAPEAFKRFVSLNPYKTRDEFEEHANECNRTRDYALSILMAYDELKAAGCDCSDVILPCIAGVIGKHPALELLKLYELQGCPTLDDVLSNPDTCVIPDDLSLRHKLLMVLVHEAQSDCDKAKGLLAYIKRFPRELARCAVDAMIVGCPEIVHCPEFVSIKNK